jgi:hypothetical protein
VKFAAALMNIGPPLNFEDDHFVGAEFDLPSTAKLGVSYERKIPRLRGGVLATFDLLLPSDGDNKQHIGAEYEYEGKLFVRGGFKGGYDSQGATFGLGVKYRKFALDYAVQLISNDLGDSHRIGFALKI